MSNHSIPPGYGQEYLKINLKACENPIEWKNSSKLLGKRSKSYKKRPIPCTKLFKPVCASYLGVKSTFRNECLLNAENIKYDRDWRIVKTGICSEDYSNVPQTKEKPSKSHSVKKRSYANNNFVDYTAESQVPNNDLFVYMPTAFQTQFLNRDVEESQQQIPVYKAYDDITSKFLSIPTPYDVGDTSHHKDTAYEDIKKNFIKKSFSVPEPSDINTFLEHKEYFYTFKKVEPNREHVQIERKQFKINPETEKNTFKEFERNLLVEQKVFENVNSKTESKIIIEMPVTISTPLETTLTTYTEISAVFTTSQPEVPKKIKQSKRDKNSPKIKECELGIISICGVLPSGTVQTFETMCEMMNANIYLKTSWAKLHDGECESCKTNCERDYHPICVTRNGINYTMVNDCYFNMGICMDKKSKWKKISSGECERYTRIPDKYENLKPVFPYTSSYFTLDATTTAISSNSLTTNKPLRLKYRKSKIRKASFNKVVSRCSSSSNENDLYGHEVSITTENSAIRFSMYRPHTDSYIMSLVNDKA